MKSLKNQTAQARADLEAEAKKLLDQQAEQLEQERQQILAQYQDEIDEKLKAVESVRRDLADKRTELMTTSGQLIAVQAELGASQDQLLEIKTQVEVQQRNLLKVQARATGVSEHQSQMRAAVGELEDKHTALTTELEGLAKFKARDEHHLATLRETYKKEQEAAELTLHNLTSRSERLALAIDRDEKAWVQVRQELADRQVKLDEREEVLERRGLKVSRDERNLARNTDLMNL